MRFIILGILFLLVLGCVTPEIIEEPERNTSEERPAENISEIDKENESEEVEVVNETIEESEPIEEVVEEPEEEIIEKPEDENRILFGGRYALVIDDVVWYGDKSCAAISIEYAEGGMLKKDVICPRVDYYWISPDGHRYRIFVAEVAAGYSGETWAEVYVYG